MKLNEETYEESIILFEFNNGHTKHDSCTGKIKDDDTHANYA